MATWSSSLSAKSSGIRGSQEENDSVEKSLAREISSSGLSLILFAGIHGACFSFVAACKL
eukprot:CAMPEP_0194328700 /NCGR_PEP_ID=MMETSP0171-20130528/45722_1 /TAXON_ID=218684 /ORGANISM="Corethron pennatum, Strain L29A3" /LENGTH=59 /DNA_ID=CAMNT_0039089149 /DNA_START=441 /DNA_END=620 /DNA_ORIENTATION=-